MSGSPQTGAKPPKSMSSRLLTMKFMQRAAASPTSSSPSSPSTKSPSSGPQAQESGTPPSAKRSKLSHTPSQLDSSEIFVPTSPSDIRAALLSAEAIRQAALERSWRGEETKWSFAIRAESQMQTEDGIRVEVVNGRLGDEQSQGDGDATVWKTEEGQGRMSFGSRRKQIPTEERTVKKDDEDDEDNTTSDSDDSEDSFDFEAKEVLNRPEQRLPDRSNGTERRPNRISGGVQNLDRIQCHKCGEFGHLMRSCPDKGRKRHQQPMGGRRTG